ncbi:Protein unzipped [Portunus trituberculatus]|uniref:Protein unzipped n=1 Tax=Portunus trituberculatus TaxID=210409 RepID=A0A5B7HWS3_PORTR|nr:Protein unzipped [Portunus trituberculatus]
MARRMKSPTSSTLKWMDAEAGQPLPAGALPVSEDLGPWCRFSDHGVVAGMVQDGVCHAPFLNSVVTAVKYEVLVSINDSARLTEIEWSRAAALSSGGIEVSKKRVLGLARSPEGAVLPGFIDVNSRRAFMLNGSQVERYDDAVILAEDEPVQYEMDHVVWDEARATTQSEDKVLLNFTLENAATEARQVTREEEYTVTDVVYWGNVRGTVKGLSSKVTGPGGQVWDMVTWGVNNDYKRVVPQAVSLEVPAGAAVDVQLVGVMHMYDSPYTAQLTAVYEDGTRRSRPVSSLHQHEYLAELRADFSRPRSLADGKELEGDFPTSEVLIASTTTTTTTTTTPGPPGTDSNAEQASSTTTQESNSYAAPMALPPPLLACCLAWLVRLAHP